MASSIQRRRGTTSDHATFTGAVGEITIDTTKDTVVVHDGAVVGGVPLLREDGSNSSLALGSQGVPSLKFSGDPNTGIYSPGANQVAVATNGTQRLTVDTAATTSTLPVVHPLGAVGTPSITFTGDLNTGIYSPTADTLAFVEGGSEAMRIDSTGRLLVGTSTTVSTLIDAGLQVQGTGANAYISSGRWGATASASALIFNKSRGATVGTRAIVQADDVLGEIIFTGDDGTSFVRGANIVAQVDGTPGTNDMPGRLVFSTTADGASSSTERMRITSAGLVGIGTSAPGTLLDISSNTGSASPVPTEIRLTSTLNASDWSTTLPWARIGFYSADTSLSGPKTEAAIGVVKNGATGGNSSLYFYTDPGDGSGLLSRLVIKETGNVGIGTTSPTDALQVANGNILIGTGGSSAGYRALYFGSSSTASARFAYIEKNNDSPYDLNIVAQTSTSATSAINFKTTPINTAATIDSSGRLLVRTSSSVSVGGAQSVQQIFSNSSSELLSLTCGNNNAGAAGRLVLGHSRSTTYGSYAILSNNDLVGSILFAGDDGTDLNTPAAQIDCLVDGTPGANDMPGRLVFSITADGAASPTERMRINSSGQILAGALGTAALPIISFLNDPNTGIYSPGADQLAVATNGTGRLFVDSGGNIGIGNSAPQDKLSITGGAISFSDTGGAARNISWKNLADNISPVTIRGDSPNGTLTFLTNTLGNAGTERLRITSAGLVGIGTSAPSSLLEISGTNEDGRLTISNSSSAITLGNTLGTIFFRNYDTSINFSPFTGNVASIAAIAESTYGSINGARAGIAFSTNDITRPSASGPLALIERMRLDSQGSLGIGTTSPDYTLNVQGTVGVGKVGVSGTYNLFWAPNTIGQSVRWIRNNAGELSIGEGLTAGTNEHLRIDPSGRLLVGTIASPAHQLQVSTDSAGKPSTNTWTIVSDERIKEEIELADLDLCYQAVKNIPLKRFKWKDEVYTEEQVRDRRKLGWIAQDVEAVFPKAVGTYEFKYNQVFEEIIVPAVEEVLDDEGNVTTPAQPERIEKGELISEDVIEDCRDLNSDQLYAAMYGAIQKLMVKVETLETELAALKAS